MLKPFKMFYTLLSLNPQSNQYEIEFLGDHDLQEVLEKQNDLFIKDYYAEAREYKIIATFSKYLAGKNSPNSICARVKNLNSKLKENNVNTKTA